MPGDEDFHNTIIGNMSFKVENDSIVNYSFMFNCNMLDSSKKYFHQKLVFRQDKNKVVLRSGTVLSPGTNELFRPPDRLLNDCFGLDSGELSGHIRGHGVRDFTEYFVPLFSNDTLFLIGNSLNVVRKTPRGGFIVYEFKRKRFRK